MSLFTKAKTKSKTAAKKVKKSTTWAVGDPEGDQIGSSVKELIKISGEIKALDAKKKLHAQVVSKYAYNSYVDDFARNGVVPDSPMKVVNSDGDSVTFVAQDRSGQYKISDEQMEDLVELLGEDLANSILYTETKISFSREIMAIPGVVENVEKALEACVRKMVKNEIISEEQADGLIEIDEKVAFKPGTLARAATIVGNNKTLLIGFLRSMGSSFCTYVK